MVKHPLKEFLFFSSPIMPNSYDKVYYKFPHSFPKTFSQQKYIISIVLEKEKILFNMIFIVQNLGVCLPII